MIVETVADIDHRTDLTFTADTIEVQEMKQHLGAIAKPFDSFFVAIADGDYTEVWGMHNTIPWLDKEIVRIF